MNPSPMRRRLRILHLLTNAFDPPWNWDDDPVSRLIWPASAIFRHTDRRRFELVLGTLRPPPPEAAAIPGLRLYTHPISGPRGYAAAIFQLARWLQAERIDIIQTHLFDASVVGMFAAHLAGTPVTIATGHHSHEFSVMPRGLSFFLDALCTARLAAHTIAPSTFMREALVATYRMDPARIAVVPHGLDDRRLQVSPAGERARVRAELGLEGQVVVGAVGRLFWIKQYGHLLQAFAAAARTRPQMSLLIVGEGEDRAALQEQARRLGIADRLAMPGLRGDVTRLLSAMDLFVHPALTESFGLVLIEAMAAGKPVVSTSVGIAPEVITPDTGLLVPPTDGEGLTAALEQMLTTQDRWAAMGRAAQRVARQFTADKMVAAYEDHARAWHDSARTGPPA